MHGLTPAVEKLRREGGIRGAEQVVQKFFRGAMRGGDLELIFDVAAHDVGNRDGEFPYARGLHEPADILETLQRDFEQLQRAGRAPPPRPAPGSVAAGREQRDGRQQGRHLPQGEDALGPADVVNVVSCRGGGHDGRCSHQECGAQPDCRRSARVRRSIA